MKTTKKKTTKKQSTKKKETSPSEGLSELFLNELKDIYWAEKELVKAIPKMVKNAEAEELATALNEHLEQTKEHVTRLEEVFSLLGEKAVAKKCEAMSGLVKEAEEIMKETEKGPVRDAGIILAGQKVEHYEIATYGTLCTFANLLEQTEVASILEETLHEEKDADEKLSEIATSSINIQAVEEEDAVMEDGEE
jgi:ferritin-like metal-binding protein YciE